MRYKLLPKFLQYELTYACNSHCTFCYNPNHKQQLDDTIRFSVLDELNKYRIDHVQLIGGEVTILPNLPEYLKRLTDVGWRSLVTNGRIFVKELAGLVDEIYLSLHGDKELHESITRAEGSFEIIENTIKKYVELGIIVHSDTVLTKINAHKIFDIASRASKLGMKTIFVNIFQPAGIGFYSSADLSPSIHQIRDAITQLIRARNELGIDVHFGTSTPFCLDERIITENLAFRCGTGDWFASINPYGELRICNQSNRSYGNVLKTALHEIWHSSKINKEYRNLSWMKEPCNSCVVKEQCLGGCRVSDTGSPRIDLIVERDLPHLLGQQELAKLKDKLPRSKLTGY
ncbi:MAG: radical SAM protein [Acidobacteria bacterium]|nr:radical SAM protein [Acidobacteriota bacterium]MCA1639922.1 radical SAM protein [Acidobacteriota bacterium]